jgi:hypothetical protein
MRRCLSRIDNLLGLVAEGGLAAQAVGPKLKTIQGQLNGHEVELAEIEGRLAAVNITSNDIQAALETLRANLSEIGSWSWDAQQTFLQGLVKRIELAVDEPLKLNLSVPILQVRTYCREWLPRLDSNQE